MLGALGDIHGDFEAARSIISRHADVTVWLCVGDIADDPSTWLGAGRGYESLGGDVYWIHGNNDNFDAIAAGDLPDDLHHIANGTAIDIARPDHLRQGYGGPPKRSAEAERSGLLVAGLGGTFAPTWYESAPADLPHPTKGTAKATELADKRRHFVRAEVDACKAMRGIDILLTHEAAKPFRPFPGGRGPDAGKAQINEVLAAMQPRLHLFGHHHRFSEQEREGVPSIGLDLVTRGYLLIETPELRIHTVKY